MSRLILLAALAALATPAAAQEAISSDSTRRSDIDDTDERTDAGDKRAGEGRSLRRTSSAASHFVFLDERPSLAVGVAVAPRYAGARRRTAVPFVLGSQRKGPFFVDSSRGIGADVMTDWGLYGSLSVNYAPRAFFERSGAAGTRPDGSRYAALDRIPGSVSAVAHVAQHFWTGTAVFVEAEFAPRWGNHYTVGFTQTLIEGKPLSVSMQGAVEWSDARMNRTFFGINRAQSVASGWSEYVPGAGLSRLSLSMMAKYELSRHWSILGLAEVSRLPNRVAKAPFVSRATSVAVGMGLQYTW